MKAEIHDDVLGLLKQDLSIPEYYRSTIELPTGEVVNVTLDTQYLKDEEFLAVLERAHQAHSAILAHREKFRHALSDEYLSEYNKTCGEGDSTSEEFLSHMQLEIVEFLQDGSFKLYFSPIELEDFFGDHIVKMGVNPDLSIRIIKMQ